MSEESAPKLRLKPKLVSDPAATPQQPAATPTAPQPTPAPAAAPAAPAAEEPKIVRLKPRLTANPIQETAPAPAVPEPVAAEIPAPVAEPVAPEPLPVEAPPADKPVVKFSLKPKAASAAPMPAPAAVPTDAPPPAATLSAPPPPSGEVPAPVLTDTGEEGEPAEITAIRKASARPFPPPGKFPPPGAAKPAPPWAKPAPAKGSKKKLVLMGGGALVAVLVLGGAFVAYKKFTAEPPPPPPRPKIVAKPVAPQGAAAVVQTAVDKAKEQAAAPVNEVLQADQPAPATVKPAETPVAAPAQLAVAPVAEPPPPPPVASPAFKAWVENLKIGGVSVRVGKPVRMVIGRTAYVTGDLVNPQLGIIFESYNPETRMLTFADKSGAKVERRD